MSRHSYEGSFRNPCSNFFTKEIENEDGELSYEIWVRHDRKADGSCDPDSRHTSTLSFECGDDADEYIESLAERFEEDYDNYLEENRYAIVQMERYEMFRNEY